MQGFPSVKSARVEWIGFGGCSGSTASIAGGTPYHIGILWVIVGNGGETRQTFVVAENSQRIAICHQSVDTEIKLEPIHQERLQGSTKCDKIGAVWFSNGFVVRQMPSMSKLSVMGSMEGVRCAAVPVKDLKHSTLTPSLHCKVYSISLCWCAVGKQYAHTVEYPSGSHTIFTVSHLADVLLANHMLVWSNILEALCNKNPLPLTSILRFTNVRLILLWSPISLKLRKWEN